MFLENRFAALAMAVQDRMESACEGLSFRAAAVLLTLSNRGPLPISMVAEIVGVSQPTATRLIDGLEKQDLIRRRPRDGRSVTICLTPRGRRTATRLQGARHLVAGEFLGPLRRSERKALSGVIDCLLFHATEGRREARTICRSCDHGVCIERDCPVDRRAAELEQNEED